MKIEINEIAETINHAFNTTPVAAVALAIGSAFLADNLPVIQFVCIGLGILVSLVTLFNKILDTIERLKKLFTKPKK